MTSLPGLISNESVDIQGKFQTKKFFLKHVEVKCKILLVFYLSTAVQRQMLFYITWICEYIVENVIYFDKPVKVFDFPSIPKISKYNRIIIPIFILQHHRLQDSNTPNIVKNVFFKYTKKKNNIFYKLKNEFSLRKKKNQLLILINNTYSSIRNPKHK